MKTSDVIFSNPYLMFMLEHFGIKLEVHEKTVEEICSENEISTWLFLTIANLFNGFKAAPVTTYSTNDIHTLINYLKNSHQYYIKEKYPQIQDYIKQISKINSHPEILMIDKFFDKYLVEVTEHLDYENLVAFPYVLNLGDNWAKKAFDGIAGDYSVTDYREHHNDIEEKLNDLKNLLIKYLPINDDQQIRRKLLLSLFELEYDLNIHAYIEDSILIPMVEEMEQLSKEVK